MKRFLILFIAGILGNHMVFANVKSMTAPNPLGVSIVFVSKAYWDGGTKSCLDRERGCCIHIVFGTNLSEGQIMGDMNYSESFTKH